MEQENKKLLNLDEELAKARHPKADNLDDPLVQEQIALLPFIDKPVLVVFGLKGVEQEVAIGIFEGVISIKSLKDGNPVPAIVLSNAMVLRDPDVYRCHVKAVYKKLIIHHSYIHDFTGYYKTYPLSIFNPCECSD